MDRANRVRLVMLLARIVGQALRLPLLRGWQAGRLPYKRSDDGSGMPASTQKKFRSKFFSAFIPTVHVRSPGRNVFTWMWANFVPAASPLLPHNFYWSFCCTAAASSAGT
jgi:hypothetical protein